MNPRKGANTMGEMRGAFSLDAAPIVCDPLRGAMRRALRTSAVVTATMLTLGDATIACAGPFPPLLPLATILGGNGSSGFTLVSGGAFDSAGESVSAAGDVNGDGIDDLIVGADGYSHIGRGYSYVVFGNAAG